MNLGIFLSVVQIILLFFPCLILYRKINNRIPLGTAKVAIYVLYVIAALIIDYQLVSLAGGVGWMDYSPVLPIAGFILWFFLSPFIMDFVLYKKKGDKNYAISGILFAILILVSMV